MRNRSIRWILPILTLFTLIMLAVVVYTAGHFVAGFTHTSFQPNVLWPF